MQVGVGPGPIWVSAGSGEMPLPGVGPRGWEEREEPFGLACTAPARLLVHLCFPASKHQKQLFPSPSLYKMHSCPRFYGSQCFVGFLGT